MSTVAVPPMYGWDMIPWKKLRRSVWKLQKRIYRATRAEFTRPAGTDDNVKRCEEPYDGKLSRTVLQPSGGGDPVA